MGAEPFDINWGIGDNGVVQEGTVNGDEGESDGWGISYYQGVEDDAMNIICLGGRTTGIMVAIDLVLTFIEAKYIGAERHTRRLNKIKALENS